MIAVFLIPDGVGIRNFVLGPFLKEAAALGTIHLLHHIPEDLLALYQREAGEYVHWHPLIDYQERPHSFMLRNALVYAHMYWIDTYATRFRLKAPLNGSLKNKAARFTARLFGRMMASQTGIQTLDRWHRIAVSEFPEVAYYRNQFLELKPDIVFCSHQRPIEVLPPVLAAKSLGIPTATFIFSWDNLSSKGRIAAPFDHYLVWSNDMRQELLDYYPDVSSNQIHVVGTPQFTHYANQSLIWSREEFFDRIEADSSRPLICYSGGDVGTCPQDPQHLKILLDLIRTGRIQGKPQVLMRPSPVDDGSRYDQVRRDYPELIYAQPTWLHAEHSNWAQVFPLPEDIQFLANLTYYSDLNINLASTMTLDFAIRDKPVVNIAFDVTNPPPFGVPTWNHDYQYEHYRPVVEFGAARFARSPEMLAAHVNVYLADPTLDQEQRRQIVELEIRQPIDQANQCIIETLTQIAGSQPSSFSYQQSEITNASRVSI